MSLPEMSQFEPLRFQPIFRDYIWGGQQLAGKLGKQTGPGIWAESWEIVDHDQAQSIVAGGSLDGRTLGDLMAHYGPDMAGTEVWKTITNSAIPESLQGRFPLLLKFLDAAQDLSVQVHPNDALAAKLVPPDLGKTEAWYVLDAAPGSRIFAGLKTGIGKNELAQAIRTGNTADVLHSFEPAAGDCILIPAGTVHAIGAGLLILEIQQASNTTWRLFDWNRVDQSGKSRELHIEQALGAIDFSIGPVRPVESRPKESNSGQLLVDCKYFQLRRWTGSNEFSIGGNGQMHLIVVTRGQIDMSYGNQQNKLSIGETRLIPASSALVKFSAAADSELIEICI